MEVIKEFMAEQKGLFRRLRKDLQTSSQTLGAQDARYLVDMYYQLQEYRKRAANQTRASQESSEPFELVEYVSYIFLDLEKTIRKVMDYYTGRFKITRWARSIYGMGPVLTAGIFSHIDIQKAPTAGSLWRYAGLDPTIKWEKKKKRPWNARLKTLVWKFADCQKKFSNCEKSFYGPLYRQYKLQLQEKNEKKEYQEAAKQKAKIVGKKTAAYKYYSKGLLSPGHVDARALRWIGKLFLSHWHSVHYEAHYAKPAPRPYVIAILGHAHEIAPPNTDIE